MSVTVKIPTQMRSFVGGAAELKYEEVSTLRDVVVRLQKDHPELAERMIDEKGEIRRFINVYVGDEDVRFLDGLNTSLEGGEVVSVLPAVAGGATGEFLLR